MGEETPEMMWEFNAPRAFDFTKQNHDDMENPEDYFNFDHENNVPVGSMDTPDKTEAVTSSDLTKKYDCENVNDDQNNNIPHNSRDFGKPENDTSSLQAKEHNTVCEHQIKSAEVSTTSGISEHTHIVNTAACQIKLETDDDLATVQCKNDVVLEGCHAVSATTDMVCHIESAEIPTNGMSEKKDTVVERSVENHCESKSVVPSESAVGVAQMSDTEKKKKESFTGSTADQAPTENTTCEAMDDIEAETEEPDTGIILPNLVTASKLADWNRAKKVTSNSAQIKSKTQKKKQERRSIRLSTIRNQRRSNRLGTPPVPSGPGEGPPKKRPRKSIKNTPVRVVAVTPDVLRRSMQKSAQKHVKSTEELEMERIEQMRYYAKQLSEESSKSFKKALCGSSQPKKAKHAMKCTRPVEFKFHTDERLKSSEKPSASKTQMTVDFSKGLRKHPPSPKKFTPTIPQPFNLTTTRKRKMEPEFVPMAKALIDFQTKPLIRTRTELKPSKGPLKAFHQLTVAKTPQFESRSRTRSQTVVSAKEAEELEIQEMKNYQFKAKPVNRAILEQASALPTVEKKEPTKVIGFNLEIGKRFEGKKEDESSVSPRKEFKARPIPKEILTKVTGVKEVAVASVTTPSSPAFALKHRMPVAQKNKENFEAERALKLQAKKAAEKQHVLPVNVPVVTRRKNCELKPFSFDAKDKERFAKKEEKIQEIIQKEKEGARSFKATPILSELCPDASLPPKQVKPNTESKPFNFASDEIGAQKAAKWKEGVEEEMKVLKEKSEFKANTGYVKVLYGKSFQPVKEGKHTEVMNEFNLHSEKRASQRLEFDERMRTKEEELQMNRLRQQELDEEREKEEIARMRKEARHSAAPIRNYKPVVIEPSMKPLTKAMSPSFSQRFSK